MFVLSVGGTGALVCLGFFGGFRSGDLVLSANVGDLLLVARIKILLFHHPAV